MSLGELSRQSRLAKTTTFRLLKTLAELGYVGYDPTFEVYFPGPDVMSLGFSALATMEIREIARPCLAKLSRTIDETVNLALRDDLEIVYCERIATRKLIHINVGPGTRLPVHNTSLGRCLVAFLPPSERNSTLAKLKTSIDPQSFEKLLQQIRFGHQFGYTISDGDLEPGIRAIAMPVWGMGNSLNGTTNVAVPASRMTLQQIRTTIAPLSSNARRAFQYPRAPRTDGLPVCGVRPFVADARSGFCVRADWHEPLSPACAGAAKLQL